MNSSEEIKELYEKKFKSKLREIDAIRKSGCRAGCLSLILGAIFMAIGIATDVIALIAIGLFGGMILSVYMNFVKTKNLDDHYKTSIVKAVIDEMFEEPGFYPDKSIPEEAFRDSNLFKDWTSFGGRDLIVGKLNHSNFQFSQCTASKETGHQKFLTVFTGLFFQLESQMDFKGTTLIKPHLKNQLFGNILKFISDTFSKMEEIKFGDEAFENEFMVYSSDVVESQKLMSPELRHELLEIKKHFNRNLYLSFTGNQIYGGIWLETYNLFVASSFSSNVKLKKVEEIFFYLNLIKVIHNSTNQLKK